MSTIGVGSNQVAEMALQEIREAWWGMDRESLETWRDACERDITHGADPNIAVIVWGYVTAALDNMRGNALTLERDAENFYERTLSEGALALRRRVFDD